MDKENINITSTDTENSTASEKQSKKNVIFFSIGFIMLIAGYFALTMTDSRGQNWASILTPILLIGAYIVIGISMIIK
ncbi:hypothetical protein HZA55_04285 [Candidatus Poribacteria bacterium]|nr:hypothetical protein [Candidatus Poribacteria bacterium]